MTIFAKLLAFLRSLLGLPAPWRHASVEVFGHRRHFGKVREIGWLRGRFLEVEELEHTLGRSPERTVYGAGAIFSITWLSDEEGERRLEDYHERRRRQEEDAARWRADEAEQERRRERVKTLRDAVAGAVGLGTTTREGLVTWLTGDAPGWDRAITVREAFAAIDGAADRRQIVEDPEGSGTYRLPTEDEEKRRDSDIPF